MQSKQQKAERVIKADLFLKGPRSPESDWAIQLNYPCLLLFIGRSSEADSKACVYCLTIIALW